MKFRVYIHGIYIGKTGRAFCTTCKEHMRDVSPKNLARLKSNTMNNKSALVKHVQYIYKITIWIGITQFWQKKQIVQQEDF